MSRLEVKDSKGRHSMTLMSHKWELVDLEDTAKNGGKVWKLSIGYRHCPTKKYRNEATAPQSPGTGHEILVGSSQDTELIGCEFSTKTGRNTSLNKQTTLLNMMI